MQSQQTRNHFLDKKMLGTLFEEEEIGKRDNMHNQEAKNEKGQKRFHGAFEGGFEAGYKNTVGSRDGWAPQKFVSSRNNRAKLDNQTINSFMDDEDLGKQKLGVNVTIHTDFDTFGNNEINLLQQSLGQGYMLGSAPEELIYRDNKSIGYQALASLKKSLIAQRKNKELSDKDDEFENYNVSSLMKSNNQFSGLGFKLNIQQDQRPSALESTFWTYIKSNSVQVTEFDEEKRKKDNRIRMDGQQDVEQEEYLKTLQEGDEEHQDKPRKQVRSEFSLELIADLIPLRMEVKDYRIDVPKDYDPYHRAKELLKQGYDESQLFILKQQSKKKQYKREELFKEPETAQSIRQDAQSKKFVKSTAQSLQVKQEEPLPGQVINLFPNHKDKQLKYSNYVLKKTNQPFDQSVLDTLYDDEVVDFERLYQMFQVQSKHVINTPTEPKKEPEKNPFYCQRTQKRWVPEEQFCKRMGIVNPYNADEVALIDRMSSKTRQPNVGGDSNRDFLMMDKKVFTSGGFYKESNVLDREDNHVTFDPTQLGLPLSFKSNSFDRNQKERLQQIENQERSKLPVRNRNDKYGEAETDNVAPRIEDQNLFDLIFGDDE